MKITPLLTFLTFSLAVTAVIGLELNGLLSRRGTLLALERTHQIRQRENDIQRKKLSELEKNESAITASIQKINSGVTSSAPVAGSFRPLYGAGIPVEFQMSSSETWDYQFGPAELEFHRLLPALTSLENEYPLLRFSHLELTSLAKPFTPSASAIHVRGTFSVMKTSTAGKTHP